MKIYILVDMEGISGIRNPGEVLVGSGEYAYGRELMMQDVNAAVDGCFAGGANELVVCDTHASGGQLKLDRMDKRARYETPNRGMMMPSLDESFAGGILLGHHAMAGTLDGFLDHTMSSASWFEFTINGSPAGEIAIEAAYAAAYDVPVIMVSGDEATAREASALLGNVETAAVKRGIGRNRANCLSLDHAHALIRSRAERAVRNSHTCTPYKPALPGTAQLTFYRSDMADPYETRPEIERVNARTIRKQFNNLKEIRIL